MSAATNPKLSPDYMREKRPSGYDLSRAWFDFVLEATEDIKPHHYALYFFIVERANRSGWKNLVDMPTDYSMKGAAIGNFTTYKNCLLDLEKWGFIKWEVKSKNQYGCNKVKVCFDRNAEALHEAQQENNEVLLQKCQSTDQSNTQSTDQSTEGIYKPIKPINLNKPIKPKEEEIKNKEFFSDSENIILLQSNPKNENSFEEKEKKQAAKKEKGFADVIFPFDSPAFKEIWNIWIEYRKQQKIKPYQAIGLQAALTKLANDANGDEQDAIEIIKFSMSKQWQGLYPEKNKIKPLSNNKQPVQKYDLNKVFDRIYGK